MLKKLQRQLEAGLGEDKDKDIFVLIVDRVNTGARGGRDNDDDALPGGSKLRTRLSSKAAPFTPLSSKATPFVPKAIEKDTEAKTKKKDKDNSVSKGAKQRADKAEKAAESSTKETEDVGCEAETPEAALPPVKHTFIHFAESTTTSGGLSRCSSAPALLSISSTSSAEDTDSEASDEEEDDDFDEDEVPQADYRPSFEKALQHEAGNCRPCAFFLYKDDGCRWGDNCSFCHLCPKGEIKARRKMRYASRRAYRGKQAAQRGGNKNGRQQQTRTRVLLLKNLGELL